LITRPPCSAAQRIPAAIIRATPSRGPGCRPCRTTRRRRCTPRTRPGTGGSTPESTTAITIWSPAGSAAEGARSTASGATAATIRIPGRTS
jgi:hypothetical protein